MPNPGVEPAMIPVCSLAFVCSFAAAALAQDDPAVELTPRFEACRLQIEARFDIEPQGEPGIPGASLVQSGVVRLTPVPDDEGMIRLTFERWRTELTRHATPDQPAISAVFDTQDLERPPEDDFARLGAIWRAIAPTTLELRLEPDGGVAAIAGLDAANGLAEDAWPDGLRGLGVFAPDSAASWLAGVWQLDPGRAGTPRRVGDTWTSATRVRLGSAQAATVNTKHLMERIADGVAVVSADAWIAVEGSEGSGAALKPSEQEWSVRATWDIARGRVKGRVEERSCVWEATLLGGVERERVKAASRVELTALD